MARPHKSIKYKLDPVSHRYMVQFLEEPGAYHATPESDPAKALAWARRNRERILAGAEAPLRLRDFCFDFFLPTGSWGQRMMAKGHRFGAAYLSVRQGHVDNYIIPLFGDLDPRELSGRYIDDELIGAKQKNGRPLAPATKYKINYSLNLILEDLLERGIITTNPLAGIKAYSKAAIAPRGALPRDSLPKLFPVSHGALVRVWGGAMWAACMLVLLDTGMRPGELRALRWRELYGEERAFVVRHGIEAGTTDVVKGTKTDQVRTGSITLRTAQELAIWRSESRHAEENDFIFTLDGAAPITGEGIIKAFRRGLAEVGLDGERWTPYWLRHSFVTYSLGALSEEEVALLAGHSVEVDRIYQHPDDELALHRSRMARDKLDKVREK
jgi:integrase